MLTAAPLLARPEFEVHAVACKAHHRHWSAPECRDDYRIVLVRRGQYRRDADGTTTDLDPTVGYPGVPGDQDRAAHPAGRDHGSPTLLQPRLSHTAASDRAGAIYVHAPV